MAKCTGIGVVANTGQRTEIGRISDMLADVAPLTTPLLQQMEVFARWLTLAILGLAGLVFVLGVLLVPTAATFLWLSAFGGTGLYMELFGEGTISQVVEQDVALSLHGLLDRLPLADITTVLATVIIVIFFVTSSDSGSLVDDMVTSGGDPNPPRPQRVFWALSEGAVAASLLLAGGLKAMQAAAISAGLPMSLLLAASAAALAKALMAEVRTLRVEGRA